MGDIRNCAKCGGTHFGSSECPFTDEDIKQMNKCPHCDGDESECDFDFKTEKCSQMR